MLPLWLPYPSGCSSRCPAGSTGHGQDTLPRSGGAIPLLDLHSNRSLYFFSCCVRSRVKGGHFPLPPDSLNHSQCSAEDLESPYGSEHPVSGFDELYCPERGESGTSTWAGQQLPRAAPGVSRDGLRWQQDTTCRSLSSRGAVWEGKAKPCTIWDFKLILSAQLTGLPTLQTAR